MMLQNNVFTARRIAAAGFFYLAFIWSASAQAQTCEVGVDRTNDSGNQSVSQGTTFHVPITFSSGCGSIVTGGAKVRVTYFMGPYSGFDNIVQALGAFQPHAQPQPDAQGDNFGEGAVLFRISRRSWWEFTAAEIAEGSGTIPFYVVPTAPINAQFHFSIVDTVQNGYRAADGNLYATNASFRFGSSGLSIGITGAVDLLDVMGAVDSNILLAHAFNRRVAPFTQRGGGGTAGDLNTQSSGFVVRSGLFTVTAPSTPPPPPSPTVTVSATVGTNQTVTEGNSVTLSGTVSSTVDATLAYQWLQTDSDGDSLASGSPRRVTLTNGDGTQAMVRTLTANATFTAPDVSATENYHFRLIATATATGQPGSTTRSQVVTIAVENQAIAPTAPTVTVGPDQTVFDGDTVTLTGNVSGGDGNLTYQWQQITSSTDTTVITSGAGWAGALAPAASAAPGADGLSNATFTAPNQITSAEYVFLLTGTGGGVSTTGTVVVTVVDNDPPAVPAIENSVSGGLDPNRLPEDTVNAGSVFFSSPGITNPDGDALTQLWTAMPTSPAIVFGNGGRFPAASYSTPELSPEQRAIVYTITFTTTDTQGNMAIATTAITVIDDDGIPTADAGADQDAVNAGDTVTLDGSNSLNSAGVIAGTGDLDYHWEQVDAPQPGATTLSDITITDDRMATATFVAPSSTGARYFRLSVTDNITGRSHSGFVTITVSEQAATAPTVNAGSNQTVFDGDTVTLTGNVSGGDGALTYQWQQITSLADHTVITGGTGWATALTPAASATPGAGGVSNATFTAPNQITSADYVFLLTGTGTGGSTTDTVVVTVVDDDPPVVSSIENTYRGDLARVPENEELGDFEELVATVTNAPDNDTLTYAWMASPASPGITFDPTDATGSAGVQRTDYATPELTAQQRAIVYTITFTATDSQGNVGTATTTMTVIDGDGRPTADAGADQTVAAGQTVVLDGSGSLNSAGVVAGTGDLDYTWVQTSDGSGNPAVLSEVALSNAMSATATFAAPASTGPRFFRLSVSDNIVGGGGVVDYVRIGVVGAPMVDVGTNCIDSDFTCGQSVTEGASVTLSGTVSSTVDATLAYQWLQTDSDGDSLASGSPRVALTDDTGTQETVTSLTANATFTAPDVSAMENYYFRLIATATAAGQVGGATQSQVVTIGVENQAAAPDIRVGWRVADRTRTISENAGTVGLFAEILEPEAGTSLGGIADFTFRASITGGNTGDYALGSAGNQTVTLGESSRSAQVSVTITDDALNEATETFTVVLDSLSDSSVQFTAATTAATVTITDNDAITATIEGPATAQEGAQASFTVRLSGESQGEVTVQLDVSGVTPADYTLPAEGDSVMIRAGATTASYVVTLENDVLNEATEDLVVSIGTITPGSGAGVVTAAGSPSNSATTEIMDSNPVSITLPVTEATTRVGEGGTATLNVRLSIVSAGAITATYSITGVEGSDYDNTVATGSVRIDAGQISGQIRIPIRADGVGEPDETLTVRLTGAEGASAAGVVTIGSDNSVDITIPASEAAVQTFTLAGPSQISEGGAGTYTLTRSGVDLSATLSVNWNAVGGTVTGADFNGGTLPGGTVDFSGSQTTGTFAIGAFDDTLNEAAETFAIRFAAAGATVPDDYSVTITDDDAITATIERAGDENVPEGSTAVFNVILSGGTPTVDTTLSYAISGTAVSNDYADDSGGSITIEDPATQGQIRISILADEAAEDTETLIVTLTGGSGAGTVSIGSVPDNAASIMISTIGSASAQTQTCEVGVGQNNQNQNVGQGTTLNVLITFSDGCDNVVSDGNILRIPYFVLPWSGLSNVAAALGSRQPHGQEDALPPDLNREGDLVWRRLSQRSWWDFTSAEVANGSGQIPFYIVPGAPLGGQFRFLIVERIRNGYATPLPDSSVYEFGTVFSFSVVNVGDTFFSVVDAASASLRVTNTVATGEGVVNASGVSAFHRHAAAFPGASGGGAGTFGATHLDVVAGYVVRSGIYTVTAPSTPLPTPSPTATAGPDQTVTEGNFVTLSGTVSSTVDATLTYQWLQTDSSGDALAGDSARRVTLTHGDGTQQAVRALTANATFTAPDVSATENYYFRLSATATATGQSASTTQSRLVTITVENQAAPDIRVGWRVADRTRTISENAGTINLAAEILEPEAGTSLGGIADFTFRASIMGGNTGDYALGSGGNQTVTLGDSTRSAQVSVTITDDVLNEATETFTVVLDSLSDSSVQFTDAATAATVIITDNDAITATIESAGDENVAEGGMAAFVVTLSGGTATVATTLLYEIGGTDIDASDYRDDGNGSITIPTGSTTRTISILILADIAGESTETLVVTLTGGSGAGTVSIGSVPDNAARIMISTNEAASHIFAIEGPLAINEGEGSTYTLTRTGPDLADGRLFVAWEAVAGTATAADFSGGLPDGRVEFTGVQTTATFSINILDDALNEAAETFTIEFSAAGVVPLPYSVTINDNDAITATIERVGDDENVAEGSTAVFNVTLSGATPTVETTLSYGIDGGTGHDTGDFADPGSGSITIAEATTQGQIRISILADEAAEDTETLIVTLDDIMAPGGGAVSIGTTDTASITIPLNAGAVRTFELTGTSPITISEGDMATYTLSRDGSDLSAPLSVNWEAVAGTATGADFSGGTLSSGTVVFTGSQMTGTFDIATFDDTLNEAAETFTIRFSGDGDTVVVPGDHSVTITDNDAITATIALDGDENVAEGGMAMFVVTLSGGTATAATMLSYGISGVNIEANDYTDDDGGSITIQTGSTTGSITISILADDDTQSAESTETLIVTLNNIDAPGGGDVAIGGAPDNAASIMIPADDASQTFAIEGPQAIDEGSTETYTLRRTGVGLGADTLSVTWNTVADTATGADFGSGLPGGTVSFTGSQTTMAFSITILDDTLNEAAETFTIEFSAAGETVSVPGDHSVTITDNDAITATIERAGDENVAEGGTAMFDVTLSGGTPTTDTTLSYSIDGVADSDFEDLGDSGSITIEDPATQGQIRISILADQAAEDTETLTVMLTGINALGAASIGSSPDNTADIRIPLNAAAVHSVELTGPSEISEGGQGAYTLSRTGPDLSTTLSVDWNAVAGTATGADFDGETLPDGTVSFTSSETEKTFSITIRDDTLNETTETFAIRFGTNSIIDGGVAVPETEEVTIADDDDITVTLGSDTNSVLQGNSVVFTVLLTGAPEGSASAVTVPFTVGGIATADDYTATLSDGTALDTRTLSIPAGASSGQITFNTHAAEENEPDETLIVTLGTPTVISGVGGRIRLSDTANSEEVAMPAPARALTLAVHHFFRPVTEFDETNGSLTRTFEITVDGDPFTSPTQVTWTLAPLTVEVDVFEIDPPNTVLTGTESVLGGPNEFSVVVNGDRLNEPDETFIMSLSIADPTADGGTRIGTGTVVTIRDNNDITVNLASSRGRVNEGEEVEFTVSLTGAMEGSASTVTVPFTVGGTATLNEDYTVTLSGGTSGTLIIPPRTFSGQIRAAISSHTPDEGNEHLIVTLGTPSVISGVGGEIRLGTGSARVDMPIAARTLNLTGQSSINENIGTVTFSIGLAGDAFSSPTAVTWMVTTGTTVGMAGADDISSARTGSVDLVDGTQNFSVTVEDDMLNEADETFTVSISIADPAADNGTDLATTNIEVTIVDNDAIEVSIEGPAMVSENTQTEARPTTFTVTVVLSGPSQGDVEVPLDVTSMDATLGADYTLPGGNSVVISAGATTASYAIVLADDNLNETTETLVVSIGTIPEPGDGVGEVTVAAAPSNSVTTEIIDGDPVVVSISAVETTVAEGGTATLNVRLNVASAGVITASYTITGVDDDDYIGTTSGDVRIDAGQLSGDITLPIRADRRGEAAETLTVRLTGVTAASEAGRVVPNTNTSVAMIIIPDNTSVRTLLLINTIVRSITENPSGIVERSLGFNIWAIGAHFTTSTRVNWRVIHQTIDGAEQPTSDADFRVSSGTHLFPVGENFGGTITLHITGDGLNEPPESGMLEISIADPTTDSGTIVDNSGNRGRFIIRDAAVDAVTADIVADSATVNEGDMANFTVTLSGGLAPSVDVGYTINGDGRSDLAQQLSLTGRTANVTTHQISVQINQDTLNESTETLTVTLGDVIPASGGIGRAGASTSASIEIPQNDEITFEIQRPDGAPSITHIDEGESIQYSVVANPGGINAGGAFEIEWEAEVLAQMNTDDPNINSVGGRDLAVGAGSVTQPTNLNVISALAGRVTGTIRYGAGLTAEQIALSPIFVEALEDAREEGVEEVGLRLTGVTRDPGEGPVSIDSSTVRFSINESTAQQRFLSFQTATANADEGDTVAFAVELTGLAPEAGAPVTVEVVVAGDGDNPAEDGDYGALSSNTLSFDATGIRTLSFVIADDDLNESAETVLVSLQNLAGGGGAGVGLRGGGNRSVAVEIAESDPVTYSISGADTAEEGATATFTVRLSGQSEGSVEVPISASADDGISASDRSGPPAMVTVSTGDTTAPFDVFFIDDTVNEPNESITIGVGDGFVANLAAGQVSRTPGAAGQSVRTTVTDNDAAVYSIEAVDSMVQEGGATDFTVRLTRADGSGDVITAGADVTLTWEAMVSQGNTDGPNTNDLPDIVGGMADGSHSGDVTIAAGQSEATITLSLLSDQLEESAETLTVTLGGSATVGSGGGTVTPATDAGDRTATVTIPANTAATRILFAELADGAGVQESNTGTDLYLLRLNIPSESTLSEPLVVHWDVSTSTGAANPVEEGDFETITGMVTFPVGAGDDSTQPVGLRIVDDFLNEGEEQFQITWRTTDTDTAVPLALDATVPADPDDTIFISESRTLRTGRHEVHLSGGFQATFQSLTRTLTAPLILPFVVAQTGESVANFEGVNSARVSTENGVTELVITLASIAATGGFGASSLYDFIIIGDDYNEGHQAATVTFVQQLVGPDGRIWEPRSAGPVSINIAPAGIYIVASDEDRTFVSIGDATEAATEGADAVFPITTTGGIPTRAMMVDWEVLHDTTTAADFVAVTGTATIPVAEDPFSNPTMSGEIRIRIAFDSDAHTDDIEESFSVRLTGARGAGNDGIAVVAGPADGTIARLDMAPPTLVDNAPAWGAGQTTLWLQVNEPFKVLPADSRNAAADTVSLTTLPAGDFTVTESMGTAAAETIMVNGVTAFPANQALRLSLARAIAANVSNLYVMYEYSGGNAVYDTALERGLAGAGGRNRMVDQSVMLTNIDPREDTDGDGIPDVTEARISGAAGNPFEAVTALQQPVFNMSRTGAFPFIAYSGIRRHGVRGHLGVGTVPSGSTTQTAAATITAYYSGNTFGYNGTYECFDGNDRFPANYAAPLSDGGCAPVDWGNIPLGEHTIAWLAQSADGVWAVRNGALPRQVIRRIPELNMDSQRLFTTGMTTVTLSASLENGDAAVSAISGVQILVTQGDGSTLTRLLSSNADGSRFSTTSAQTVASTWRITGLSGATLWRTTNDARNHPALSNISLGLLRETEVVPTGGAELPPLLGRAVLRQGSSAINVLAEGGMGYTLSIPVENYDDIGGLSAAGSVSDESGVLSSVTGAPSVADKSYEVMLDVNAGVAATTDRAVIRVTIAAAAGAQTVALYRYPIVAASAPLATARTDTDRDGIADVYDDYNAVAHLPVEVAGEDMAGANGWHHIRPVLPVHDLHLGETTLERLAEITQADRVDEYAEYAASQLDVAVTGSASLAAVYDFEISGVNFASVMTGTIVGGAAGVIIPLPRSLYATRVSLEKYPSGNPFVIGENNMDDNNKYGFAPLEEDGACPDDTMEEGSPYRDRVSGTLRSTKRIGADFEEGIVDACLVVYIEDGSANDEDGIVNGVIKDPLGIRDEGPNLNNGGSRHHSGAFSPAALAILLLLALFAGWARRRLSPSFPLSRE